MFKKWWNLHAKSLINTFWSIHPIAFSIEGELLKEIKNLEKPGSEIYWPVASFEYHPGHNRVLPLL